MKPGMVSATPVHVVDWAPTLLDAANAKAPPGAGLDGTSLVPLLSGGTLPERPLFWHMPFYELRWAVTPCAVIREGNWKLIDYFGDSFDAELRYREGARTELFDLSQDIGEQHDLSAREPDQVRRLQAKLRGWLRDMGAEVPGPNPHEDPAHRLREVKVKPAHVATRAFGP